MKGQLPRKLNASFRPAEQLQAISCALEESTTAVPKATLTLPPGAEPLQIHELVELFVGEESHGYFRVVSSGVNLRNQITHQLMGAADTLTDDVWAAQVAETTYTPAALFTAALTHQSVQRWQKGRCDAAVSVKTAISYDDLWTVLEKIRAENPDCMWQYDYTTTPWTLSLVEMQETIESELRIGRNIESATINITDKEMCNRLYMTVTSDNGSTLVTAENTESINKYGVVVKLATVTAQEAPNPQAYAAAILAERAEPIAYISIGGLDLKEITGDEFDRVKLGTKCRAVIPEYRETPLSERVVAKKWPDVIHEPERVTVSLANAIQTFSENLQFIRRTASSARSSASKTEKDLTHWEQIVTAQQTALDDLGITGLWQSGLVLDAYEGVKIWSSEQGVNSYLAQIAVNRTSINQAVEAVGLEWDDTANEGAGGWVPSASPAAGSVAARLALIPGQISAAASSVMSDVRAEGYIKLQAAKDAAAAEIGAQLDNGSSTISAKVKTLVEGDQSLIQLIANAVQITAGDVTVSGNIKLNDVITIENGVAKGTFGSLVITGGANLGSTNVYFNSVPLASFIKSISLTGPTNNEYTLTWENAGGNSTTKTFSRAASGVTVSWSGTTGTVTVNPQNQNFTITYPGPSSASVDSITITNTPLTGTLYTGSGGTRYAQTTENLTAWHNESDGEGGTTQTSLLDTSATVRVNIESILSAAESTAQAAGATAALQGVNLSGWQLSNSSTVNLVRDGSNNTLQTVNLPPSANWDINVGSFDSNGSATITVRNVFSGTYSDPVTTGTIADSNLQPGNIKSGVTIFGKTGTYTGSGGGGDSIDVIAITNNPVPASLVTISNARYVQGTASLAAYHDDNSGSGEAMALDELATDTSTVRMNIESILSNAESAAISGVNLSGWQLNSSSHNAENLVRNSSNATMFTVSLPPDWDINVGAFDSSGSATIRVRPVIGGSIGTEVATGTISDSNLQPENIKSGVTIFGKTGTYTGSNVTYTQATVTLQGEAETVYVQSATSGTNYYEANEQQTWYRGNGGEKTVQGTTGPKLRLSGTRQLYYLESGTYKKIGSDDTTWYYESSSGTQYYNAGTTTVYGRGGTITVTPINSSSMKKLTTATRYKAGQTDSTTYYMRNS